MATRTGTASQVDASGASGSQNVTVPTCNLAVIMWSHFDPDDGGGSTLSTLTLGGQNCLPAVKEIATHVASSNLSGCGVAILENPPTGTQALAWAWSLGGARNSGGKIIVVYVVGANMGDVVRDSATHATAATTDVTNTLTTETTDLVLAYAQRNTDGGSTIVLDGTVFIDNAVLNSFEHDASEITAGAGSTVIEGSGWYYGSMVSGSFKVASAVYTLSLTGISANEHLDSHNPKFTLSGATLEADAGAAYIEPDVTGTDAFGILGAAQYNQAAQRLEIDGYIANSGNAGDRILALLRYSAGNFYYVAIRGSNAVSVYKTVGGTPSATWGADFEAVGVTRGAQGVFKIEVANDGSGDPVITIYDHDDGVLATITDTEGDAITGAGQAAIGTRAATLGNARIYGALFTDVEAAEGNSIPVIQHHRRMQGVI